jgi:hypothetical protein
LSAPKNAKVALYVSIALTAVLWTGLIPFSGLVSWPLLLISTFFHELGHGLAALSVGHGFRAMEVNWDGSGVTYSVGDGGRLAQAWISAGGLLGPAVTAALLFKMGASARSSRMALGLIGGGLILVDLVFVRNLFGFVYVASLGAAFLLIATKTGLEFARFVMIFVATQLALSVFSRADYLFMSSAGSGPSDVSQMAEALFLPYWVWGILCGGFSVAVLATGVRQYIK